MVYKNTTEFISAIKKELAAGKGFTPFVGSGISAQSGIIMSQQFSDYLAYCVYLVLADQKGQHWSVRKRGWPPPPDGKDLEQMYDYFEKAYQEICGFYRCEVRIDKSSGRPQVTSVQAQAKGSSTSYGADHWPSRDLHFQRPLVPEILRSSHIWETENDLDTSRRHLEVSNFPCDPNASQTSTRYVKDRALRALAHWTLTLEFLACAEISEDGRVFLDEMDPAVIDSFNAHITRGKRPNLIHNMISRLSRALRTHVILTTNFDTLIEQSYRAQGEPLHTLAVSIRGGLPAFETVRSQDCLVKLHGDILETRADSSINHPPSESDKKRFFKYLRGPKAPHKRQPLDFRPSNLLVVGYSASDARCVQMIKYVLDLDSEFKVFWVCHNTSDLEKINRIFGDYMNPSHGQKCGTVGALVTDRSDLLLWEMYQGINLSLPGGGYSIQFSHHVPPERPLDADQGQTSMLFDKIKEQMKTKVICVNAASGTGQPMTHLFFEFRRQRYQTMWIELEDYSDPTDLFFNILSIISIRMGYFQLEWINFLPPKVREMKMVDAAKAMTSRLRLLVEKFRITPTEWALFLYGRNCPGGCAGWKQEDHYWGQENYARMESLMVLLKEVGFNVIYMPYSLDRNDRNENKANHIEQVAQRVAKNTAFVPSNENSGQSEGQNRNPVRVPLETVHEIETNDNFYLFKDIQPVRPRNAFEDTINRAVSEFVNLAAEEHSVKYVTRMLWLYGLTLFRQSRHPAAMISEAVFPCPYKFNLVHRDNDEERQKWVFDGDPEANAVPEKMGWFPWLANAGLFLRKPGGYAWKYRDSRLGLQYIMEHVGPFELKRDGENDPTPLKVNSLKSLRSRIHYWIGDWYLRAFLATGHYIPVIEGIYHSASAMERAGSYEPMRPVAKEIDDTGLKLHRARLFWSALCQLRRLLRVGAKSLRFWCPGVDLEKAILPKWGDLASWGDSICKQNKTGKALNKRIRLGLDVLKLDMMHLVKSVQAEGLAHGDQFAPLVVMTDKLGERTSKPNQSRFSRLPSIGHFTEQLGQPVWTKPCGKLLSQYGFGNKWTDAKLGAVIEGGGLVELLRDSKRDWLTKWAEEVASEGDLVRLVWVLTELMYRIVRRAKMLHHSKRQIAKEAALKECWRSVCVLGYNSLQLCRNLSPDIHTVECDQRVRILTLYGLALGYLERPYESNRRFNEAHALVVSGLGITEGKELARIHLRRAEMLLWQGRLMISDKKTKTPLLMQTTAEVKVAKAVARIDDAWKAIERGEISLAGVNHSSFWWYRMFVLKLGCYAALADLRKVCEVDPALKSIDLRACLPFRRRQHFPTLLVDLLRDAWIIGTGDPFRQLRALDYTLKAAELENAGEVFGRNSPINLANKGNSATELENEIRSLLSLNGTAVTPKEIDDGGDLLKEFWWSVRKKVLPLSNQKKC
ncbi:MAG: SIR2 family protein [Verrucomicrobiaceae bacterium]|nr:SIR2 family protein [Verrucomicrobiaceae bacterium]